MTMRWLIGICAGLAVGVWGASSAAGADETRAIADGTLAGLQEAVQASLTIPTATAEVLSVEKPLVADCRLRAAAESFEIPNPIEGSARVSVKASGVRAKGEACQSWLWVRVRVTARVPIALRPVKAGELLNTAVRWEEREVRPGHAPVVLAETSVADRYIGAGQVVELAAVRQSSLRSGDMVKVVLTAGSLVVEQSGRAVSCGRAQCAVLPSGKHVEGTLRDGRLMVTLP